MGLQRGPSLFEIAVIFLTFFACCGYVPVGAEAEKSKVHSAQVAIEHDPDQEFNEFCATQNELRADPDNVKRDCKRINEKDFHFDDLRILFSLFLMILWGALVRTTLKALKISLPYTVVLMFSGIIIGLISRYSCYEMYTFTALARVKPEIILFTFLPVLIFETAFGISSHVFLKASYQILLAALPGMVICTILTAFLCHQFFANYQWTLLQACFYGTIISATDPVAVVAILKEVGVAESLSTIIDGESLLNDGVAILLFEIFQDLLKEEDSHETPLELTGRIVVMFIRIAIGGPVFGYIAAKIAIFCLQRIFNDAIVEITITLASAYLTYYIAEDVLGVSGVCAVVLLGITMSSEKTCISPDIIEEVHEFWEMCAHLANTVLFIYAGIVISERGSRDLQAVDVYYLILLYCALNFIRFLMLLILSPLLSRTGYGLTWQNLIVMMWGGLRGAVGICLSLQVYEDTFFCEDKKLGPKVLFHTAGIVLLTLTINGTTTKKLLDMLQLTSVTQGRIDEMQVAVKHIMDTQKKGMAMMKHDRYLADSSWDYIFEFTKVDNPYKYVQVKSKKLKPQSSILSLHAETHSHPCPECHSMVENEPSNEEYRIMTEEARLRILKALKISYWTQFGQGILTEEAVRILAAASDNFTDDELALVHTSDLKRYWTIRGVAPWIRTKMIAQFGIGGPLGEKVPPEPDSRLRYPFWWVATRNWFENLMLFVVLVNMFPAMWEFALDVQSSGGCDKKHDAERRVFAYFNWIFTTIYFIEFLLKVVGRGCKDYWTNKWNYIDFFVLLISVVDTILSMYPCDSSKGGGLHKILKGLRLLRIVRSIRLVKPLVPAIMNFLNGKINREMFLGYDIAVGYLWAIDDVLKYITQMSENAQVVKKLKAHLEKDRLDAVREIGMIQREHPGITIAVKTRHASRSVLNQMRNALQDLRQDGLLDDKENLLLTIALEERMKRLWSSPAYIAPSSPEVLLENLNWVCGNDELKDFVFTNATMVSFQAGEIIAAAGERLNGIYVIISGMVRITYDPHEENANDKEKYGCLPNMEIRDFDFTKGTEDLLSAGSVIGESGILTKRVRCATCVCDTETASLYHIPLAIVDEALVKFGGNPFDNLELRLWRSCGIRRAVTFLPTTSFYQTWPADKIRMHLERSCVPIGPQFGIIVLPSYILDIFVIEGMVQDYVTGEMFIAPCLVSRATTKIICNLDNPKTVNRILLITQDNIGSQAEDELAQCVIASYNFRRGMGHSNDEPRERKFTLHINFSARQKKRRKSSYTADDERVQKDDTLRRRAPPSNQRRGSMDDGNDGSKSNN